jgi:hypothetical protein
MTQAASAEALVLGVFEAVQQAASVVDRLLDAGLEHALLSLLLSDRTAERHLGPPDVRNALGATGTYSANFNQLAVNLSPMAALGTPGSGMVATGPLPAALVTAGLGSIHGLEQALSALGVEPDTAREVARRVKNGAALVGVRVTEAPAAERWASLIRHESVLSVQLQVNRPTAHAAVVTRPIAPVGDQRARYEPLIETAEEARGSTQGANRSGS